MIRYIEKAEKMTLYVVPLKGLVVFPAIPQSLELKDKTAKKICVSSKENDEPVLLLPLIDPTNKNPEDISDFENVGTAAKVKDYLKLPNGDLRIIFDGLCRASVLSLSKKGEKIVADTLCKKITAEDEGGIKGEALIRETHALLDKFAKFLPKLSEDVILTAKNIKSPGLLADYIACNIFAVACGNI